MNQPESIPTPRSEESTPGDNKENEIKEKQGVLSDALKKKIANYVRLYIRQIEASGNKISDHKFANININVRRSIIQAIQAEHKKFNARPDEREADWIDELLNINPNAIEAFQIKVPQTPKSALEYEEPEKTKKVKDKPKPEKPADGKNREKSKRNKPDRVRTKGAHIMDASDHERSDAADKADPTYKPDVSDTPYTSDKSDTPYTPDKSDKSDTPYTPDTPDKSDKSDTPDKSDKTPAKEDPPKAGGGGDEPPEGPPENKEKLEVVKYYENVRNLIKSYEEIGDDITREDVDELIDKIYNLEDVLGIDLKNLEKKNSKLKDAYRKAQERVETLKDKVRKKESAQKESKREEPGQSTKLSDKTPDSKQSRVEEEPLSRNLDALAHYDIVGEMITELEAKPIVTPADIEDLKQRIKSDQKKTGINFEELESSNLEFKKNYQQLKSRLDKLREKVGRKSEGFPSAKELLTSVAIRHRLEDFRDANLELNKLEKQKNPRNIELNRWRAEIFFADQRLAQAIAEKLKLNDLSLEDPRYQIIRDEALELLKTSPRLRLMTEEEQDRELWKRGVPREVLDRRARERENRVIPENSEQEEAINAEEEKQVEAKEEVPTPKYELGQEVFIVDESGNEYIEGTTKISDIEIIDGKVSYKVAGGPAQFDEEFLRPAQEKTEKADNAPEEKQDDSPVEGPSLEEKLQQALEDDDFTKAYPPGLLPEKAFEKESDKLAFVSSWEAFHKKEEAKKELLDFYNQSLAPIGLELPSDRVEAISAQIDALVWENPSALDSIEAALNFQERKKRIEEKEKEIEGLLSEAKKTKAKAQKLEQQDLDMRLSAPESKVEGFGQSVKRAPRRLKAFFSGIFAGMKEGKNIREEVQNKGRVLKLKLAREGNLSVEDIRALAEKKRERASKAHNRVDQLEAELNTSKKAFEMLKQDVLSDFEPIKISRNELRQAATERLQTLMNGDLENLQKANEMLERLKDTKLVDYFADDSEEYIDTREARQDGSPKTKDKMPTRVGVALRTTEEIQREINFRIRGEVTNALEKKIDEFSEKDKGKFKELENLLKETLATQIGSKSKEESRKIIANLLDMKINTLRNEPKKNAPVILKIRGLQNKYLK